MSTLQKQYHTTGISQSPQKEMIKKESLHNTSDVFMISNTISSDPDKPTRHLFQSTKDKLRTPTLKIKQSRKPKPRPTTSKDKLTSANKRRNPYFNVPWNPILICPPKSITGITNYRQISGQLIKLFRTMYNEPSPH